MSRATKFILLISLGVNILMLSAFVIIEKKIQITERVLARFDLALPSLQPHKYNDLEYHPLATAAISVHGIAGYKQGSTDLNRLGHVDLDFRKELNKLGRHTAGVRIRFRTDSSRLHLPFLQLKPVSFSYPYLSELGATGIDLYIDSNFVRSLTKNDTKQAISIPDAPDSKASHLVEIYLPSFSRAELREIGIAPGSQLQPAAALKSSLVFYGTSITQGAAAPRPGLTFPAILARELGTELYNYGFSGNAHGDLDIAKTLAGIDADIFILGYSRQALGTRTPASEHSVSENLIEFCKIIKAKQPEAAIVIMTALYDTLEAHGYEELEVRRRAFRVAFDYLQRKYSNIHLVEGVGLPDSRHNDHLSDGTHPNAQGMSAVAERLLPILRTILN